MSKLKNQLVSKFAAPDPGENCSIKEAQDFASYLASVGMPFTEVVALQGTESGPVGADEAKIAYLQAMGVTDEPLYLWGKIGADDSHMYNIAKERALIANANGENAFAEIWGEHNQGHTQADAFAAIFNVPTVAALAFAELNRLKSAAGL